MATYQDSQVMAQKLGDIINSLKKNTSSYYWNPHSNNSLYPLQQAYSSLLGLNPNASANTISQEIQKAQSTLANPSFANFYHQITNLPAFQQGSDTLNNLFQDVSGVGAGQYVNPNGGGPSGPLNLNPPTTPTPPPTPTTQTVDPNVPLTTPTTPVNQATVPTIDIAPYIPATSQQQQDIINQSIAQSQSVAGQNAKTLEDLFHNNILAQVGNWTDPNSPDYQATMGQLNNIGRADQNTFGQSLSSRLAPLIAQSLTDVSSQAYQPAFTTQQGLVTSGAGTQSNLGLASLQRFMQQQDFNRQAELAKQLADKGVPSNFQTGVGAGSSLLSGFGNFFQGLGGLKDVAKGTWICTHLKKMGLATEQEVEAVHAKLYPTIVRHPIDWLCYLLFAPRLIVLADAAALDWTAVKEVLIDTVLAEPDTEVAFLIYKTECLRLLKRCTFGGLCELL